MKEWKNVVDLQDAMMNKALNDKYLLATYQRGKLPINTIMTTICVVINKAGYFPFGGRIGDHRALFADIKLLLVLGTNLPSILAARARKLKLQDPRIGKKYYHALNYFFKKHTKYTPYIKSPL